MKTARPYAFFLFFLWSLSSFAKVDHCQFQAFHFDNLTVQTGKFKDESCFVTLTPRKTAGLIYRSFLLTDLGQIMVFNSFGLGPINQDTGARVFHVFPNRQAFEVELRERAVYVTLASGEVMRFDKVLGEPTDLSFGLLTIAQTIDPQNAGGVELEFEKSLVLDSGFRLGSTPISRSSRTSKFQDPMGGNCQVSNKEVFDVKGGEVYLIHQDNQSLYRFLKRKCGNLSLPLP